MTSGPFLRMAAALTLAGCVAGCAQTEHLFPHRTTVGTLKASVSHLEFENEQLRTKMAKLEKESRSVEEELLQEQKVNGDLATRLDDARHELRQRGFELDDQRTSTAKASEPAESTGASTVRAGSSSRSKRKAPFARIPARTEDLLPDDPADDPTLDTVRPPRASDDDPQASRDSFERWLPIANDTSTPSKKKVR